MDFNEYQCEAGKTAVYPERGSTKGILYTALGIAGEAGEVAENVKKMIRDDNGELSHERREAIRKELGDVLWYIANLSEEINYDLNTIANLNIEKLRDRQDRGVLHGKGDNR